MWLVDFNARKTKLVLNYQTNNTGALDAKMDGSVLEENHLLRCWGLTFSAKLEWGFYIICIAKTAIYCHHNFVNKYIRSFAKYNRTFRS